MSRYPQGLSKLSPDLLAKAREDTATQIARILLTFVGTAIFCLLSLLTPDSALLAGNEKLNVPFAGPVSFFGFMTLGPAVLIVLRVYLQIYFEHGQRLDQLSQQMPIRRAPTLIPLQNQIIGLLSSFAFYLLLPLVVSMFAWKAAVFPVWGAGLFLVAAAVIAMHLMLPIRRLSWQSRGFVSVGAAVFAVVVVLVVMVRFDYPLRRSFDLTRANLSEQWLPSSDLEGAFLNDAKLTNANLSKKANLSGANLSGANLSGANLSNKANLTGANLTGANLINANLSGADLYNAQLPEANLRAADLSRAQVKANLSGAILIDATLIDADLTNADLTGAKLSGANLTRAHLRLAVGLEQVQLDQACGTDAKLDDGLKLNKPCDPSGPTK